MENRAKVNITREQLDNLSGETYEWLRDYSLNLLRKISYTAYLHRGEDITTQAVARFVRTFEPGKGKLGSHLYYCTLIANRDTYRELTGLQLTGERKQRLPLYLNSPEGDEYLNPVLADYCFNESTLDNLVTEEMDEIKRRELAIIRQAVTIFEKTNKKKIQDGKPVLHHSNFLIWFKRRIKTREHLKYLASLKTTNKRDSLWYDASRALLLRRNGKGVPRKKLKIKEGKAVGDKE
jgi:hypothetical protein